MALTAREWLLLPEDEQQRRKNELSPHECFLLRTDLEYIHFSEEEKKNISPEKKEAFLHPKERTEEEKEEAYTHKMLEKVMHEFGTLAPDKHLTDDEDVQNNEDGDSKK